jgi:hypothetical protein
MAESGGSWIPHDEKVREIEKKQIKKMAIRELERDREKERKMAVKGLVMGPLGFWRETEEHGEELRLAWGKSWWRRDEPASAGKWANLVISNLFGWQENLDGSEFISQTKLIRLFREIRVQNLMG